MQMTSWMSYWKMGLLAAFAGAILAGGYSFTIPNQYVVTAAMAMEGRDATRSQLTDALQEANIAILNRDNLVALIQNPRLNLYRKERQRYPVEDIAEDLFRKHLMVQPYAGANSSMQAVRIVFQYPEPQKARAVVWELVSQYQSWNVNHQLVPNQMRVLESPILPEKPISPLRAAYVILGFMAGIPIGLISLKIFRRTRAYAVVTMSIPRETKQFVDRQIAGGQYRDVSEYVRELIRSEQQRQK